MASQTRFPAGTATARIRLIRQNSRQIFHRACALRTNRPGSETVFWKLTKLIWTSASNDTPSPSEFVQKQRGTPAMYTLFDPDFPEASKIAETRPYPSTLARGSCPPHRQLQTLQRIRPPSHPGLALTSCPRLVLVRSESQLVCCLP